jgi:hypothetical protein
MRIAIFIYNSYFVFDINKKGFGIEIYPPEGCAMSDA